MGYVYKLKPAVIDFIIRRKQKSPDISCRNLATIASQRFKIRLSKSSINSVLRDRQLSSSIGKGKKRLLQIQGEIEHGGFSILQGINYKLDTARIFAEILFNQHPGISRSLINDIEDVVQALIMFKAIYDITIEPSRCYNNEEIWTLVGRRPTRSTYNVIMKLLQSSQLVNNNTVIDIQRQLMPIAGFRFLLRDNSNFFVDAELQSVWRTQVKRKPFVTTYHRARSYIDNFISRQRILPIFNIQGVNIHQPEVLDFISALNGQNVSKCIRQIELLDCDGNVIETRRVSDSGKRFFLLGFWPWQLDTMSELERGPAEKRLIWRELGVEYYYQIEEVSLSQHLVAQEVKFLSILLKNSMIGPARIGILTNIPEDIVHNYLLIKELSHWVAPENAYKRFAQKMKKVVPDNQILLSDLLDPLKMVNPENNLENIFAMLSQIIFHQFQQRFVPDSCKSWSPLKLKDVFLRQRAIIKRSKGVVSYNILNNNELCKDSDLNHICQCLNESGIRRSGSDFPWFSHIPKRV